MDVSSLFDFLTLSLKIFLSKFIFKTKHVRHAFQLHFNQNEI